MMSATPPLGLNLFVVSGLTGESILRIAARAIPFAFFMLLVVLLIAYWPALSTMMLDDIYIQEAPDDPKVPEKGREDGTQRCYRCARRGTVDS